MNILSSDEKIEAFDLIASKFYRKNFGTMSKTDFELLLFGIYIRYSKMHKLPTDDYSISRELGITQSKVRNLKLRNELQKNILTDDLWKQEFANCVETAIYDDNKKLVKVMVPEVTVMMELRHFMEENRWYDEYHLNPKLFQCPLDFFIPLCEKLDGTDGLTIDASVRKKLCSLNKQASEAEQSAIAKILNGAIEDGFKDLAWKGTTAIIIEVLKVLPFGALAEPVINGLIKVLKSSGGLNN